MHETIAYLIDDREWRCKCPCCGHVNVLESLDTIEEQLLREGEEIEYWCELCDNELIVKGNYNN